MEFDELNGRSLKSDVPSLESRDSVKRDYHNKHTDGSGNFGMLVQVEIPEDEREEGPLGKEKQYELVARINGEYDEDKQVVSLQVGKDRMGGGPSIDTTYDALVEALETAVQNRSEYRSE